MNYLPSLELREILSPSYDPCPGFNGTCKDVATWNPERGHVPRGFIGALGSLDEVQVVILVSEPGDPYGSESYEFNDGLMSQTCQHTFRQLQTGRDPYHRNLKLLLDLIFPKTELEQQLRKSWINETYLCSAPTESGSVPTRSERGCVERFLIRQLELLNGRPVIALGESKAQKRVKYIRHKLPGLQSRLIEAVHPRSRKSKRENHRSWEEAAKQVRKFIYAWK